MNYEQLCYLEDKAWGAFLTVFEEAGVDRNKLRNAIDNKDSFNDVSGSVQNVMKFQNGNVTLNLNSRGNIISISNFTEELFEKLNNSLDKVINVFNLGKFNKEFSYYAKPTTIIYEPIY